jgi:hypothetical protein
MQRHSAGIVGFAVLLGLSACKGHEKKILIYASSDIKVDDTKQHVTVSEGTTAHEQELDFTSGDPVTLDVQSPQGKLSVSAVDDGLFILNLKTDTVIGSLKHVGATARTRVSQDELKRDVDSIQKLLVGQNVSDANRNYFIVPGKLVKISSNPDGKVFGPFVSIPGSFDAGSVPELFKFYDISEVREMLANLQKQAQ